MAKRGKRYQEIKEQVDRYHLYTVDEAVSLVKKTSRAKFDETVDLASRLGVNAQHAEQNIRGTVTLPHGTGKSARVVVFGRR